jgi:hypothetical protein
MIKSLGGDLKKLYFIIACLFLSLAINQGTYTFTTCGNTGRYGPTEEQCTSAYAGTNLEANIFYSDGIQNWLVPRDGNYRIEVYGAQGGNNGGTGAYLTGEFELDSLNILQILIGQSGLIQNGISSNPDGGGGGGGTFVSLNQNPLIIAGGGGGRADQYSMAEYAHANILEDGNDTYGNGGGTNGEGGNAGSNHHDFNDENNNLGAAGGGGFYADGISGPLDTGGSSFLNGGNGGYPAAGFGGGGGTLSGYDALVSGGGGGYSGGQGGTLPQMNDGWMYLAAGGGGSYNAGENQLSECCQHYGDGQAVITLLIEGCTDPDASNYNNEATIEDGSCIAAKHNVPEDFATVQEAIDYSSAGDTVSVSSGTYYENLNTSNKTIVIIGEDKNTTIIDAGTTGMALISNNTESASLELHNFTITNGFANDGSALYLNALEFALINNCIIKNNTAYNSIIRIDNIPDIAITKTLIHNNTATNSSNSYGAIVTYDNVNLNLDFVTLAFNTRGGILTHEPNANISINNSIFWNPDASEDIGRRTSTNVTYSVSYSSFTIDLYENYCSSSGYECLDGIINSDPQFVDISGDFSLQPTSSCIDSGDPDSALDSDGSRADMGALYYSQEYGCIDIEACNYNEYSLYDDGSCIYSEEGICFGCTNPEAINYDEFAAIDDASCMVPNIIVPDDYGSIQSAFDNIALDGDVIYVRAGTYTSFQWSSDADIKLIGENRETTIIDASGYNYGIEIDGPAAYYRIDHNSLIQGFTIKNAESTAIYSSRANPTLKDLIIKENNGDASWGSAIFIGMIGDDNDSADTLKIDNVIIEDNSHSNYATVYIAMYQNNNDNQESYFEIKNSNFINNYTAQLGGGLVVDAYGYNVDIVNSNFIGNQTDSYGAALIISSGGHARIIDSIFLNNSSTAGQAIVSAPESMMINSIVYDNSSFNELSLGSAYNSIIQNLLFQEGNYIGCIDTNPLISYNNNFSIEPGSPCVDAGTDYVEYNGEIIYELSQDEFEGFAPDIGPWETSQMFVYEPIITNIEDIQDDQGGKVFMDVQRSFYDKTGLNRIESYQIEALYDNDWVGVATQNAYNDSTYRVVVNTLSDSSSTSDGIAEYRVIANMEEGNFLSETAEGYSVDNIHPSTPNDVMASSNDNDVNISWDYSQDIDFSYHQVSQLGAPEYTIDNEQTMLLDAHYNEYYMNSVDIHDNYSDKSDYVGAHDLHPGANLIGVCVLPEDNSLTNVVSGQIEGIIGEGVAASNNPAMGWVGSLTGINSSDGYWFKSSEETIHLTVGDKHETESFELHQGANLISYCCANDIPLSEIDSDCIEGIIGEGVAASWIGEITVGSLTELSTGKGYWVKTAEECELAFECTEYEQQLARVYESETIKDYAQSIEQAFYFIEDIESIELGDIVSAYCNNTKVGSRAWNGAYTDIPAMGNDNSDLTKDYCTSSSIPSFRVEKSNGETYALTGDIPVWESNGLHMLSSLEEAIILPESYSLAPAYPNPFNPTTTINFAIPTDTDVSISVYNLQGREVVSLANGSYDAGYHSVIWNADSHSSGVYFVKMVAGSYVNTQKLMLVK